MSLAVSNLLTNSTSHLCFYSTKIHVDLLKNPTFFLPISSNHAVKPLHFEFLGHRASRHNLQAIKTRRWPLRVFESDGTIQREGINKLNLDVFLSIAESLCLASSAVLSIGCAVNLVFLNSQKSLVNKVFVWQFVLLVGAVAIGGLIRRRHWRRICEDSLKSDDSGFNLLERIEKLEEDIRSLTTITRVLSRKLEKLGIRFRVTRKALKEPISETAALAQKNSEATQALAVQEDILEKELGEIQKVLLLMQEQQQKQFELILAIGKAGKLRESKRNFAEEQKASNPQKPADARENSTFHCKIAIAEEGLKNKGNIVHSLVVDAKVRVVDYLGDEELMGVTMLL
ncbi:hypothetical protein HHK36_020312 [Tetracentron sinense]|uniref:Uncharacterized protein n=1 Tax=Tetracentron sinense TaxID=13715 RepID=A0A834YTH1_TETSI|nr:hypothetical protein HHK36_020312 [Tetracentron sinense]